tara:strand:+ start:1022 stop:2899 length:1878 start_codon:yes stop_codon:yes gene_type:complete
MAEIAVPIFALGAMYIMSNQKNKNGNTQELSKTLSNMTGSMGNMREGMVTRENFSGIGSKAENEKYGAQGVPVVKFTGGGKGNQSYKPFVQDPYSNSPEDLVASPATFSQPLPTCGAVGKNERVWNERNGGQGTQYKSMNGSTMSTADWKKQQPFFGSKVTQRGIDIGNESILDNHTGTGTQHRRKKAQAPLFKPEKNMQFAHGMPNHTDFIQSRMNNVQKMNNVKPFQEIRVAPGLNKDYMDNSTGGFNAGMEARDAWMPKNVDDLRVKTNPKQSFGGVILGGKRPVQNLGVHGKMEKHGVERSWEHGPERYFTTTGAHLKNKARDNVRIGPQNRDSTMEYFGNTHNASNDQASYTKPVFRPSTKQAMEYNYNGMAHNGLGRNSKSDFGQGSYSNLPNSRALTGEMGTVGQVQRGLWAAVTPIVDMLRPTNKENVIGNARGPGNVGGIGGNYTNPVHNPKDMPRTTIRQQTTDTKHIMLGGTANNAAHSLANYQMPHTQRASTNVHYTPNASAAGFAGETRAYNAEYNARPHVRKETTLQGRAPAGNTNLLNHDQNMSVRRNQVYNPSTHSLASMPKSTMGAANYGELSGSNRRGVMIQGERLTSDNLGAFKENPFTHSLTANY